MKNKKKELVFNVMNYNSNLDKVEMWNIFNNYNVSKGVEEAVKEYLQNPKDYEYADFINPENITYGYEAIKRKIDRILLYNECGRCEYEIAVGSLFVNSMEKAEKWDCYKQAYSNLDIIVKLCIEYYQK